MEIRKKDVFYSKEEALACQAQYKGAEITFHEGHGIMLDGKLVYEIPENRPSWTVSWTVPVSVAVEVSGGLVQAVYARGGDIDVDIFDLDAPDSLDEAEARKEQLSRLIGDPSWKQVW